MTTLLNSYHFSLGNSTKGSVGFCARVKARSGKEAAEILRENLPEAVTVDTDHPAIEYIAVYLNPDRVQPRAIDEYEYVGEDDGEDRT
jgi:hypothetical protein